MIYVYQRLIFCNQVSGVEIHEYQLIIIFQRHQLIHQMLSSDSEQDNRDFGASLEIAIVGGFIQCKAARNSSFLLIQTSKCQALNILKQFNGQQSLSCPMSSKYVSRTINFSSIPLKQINLCIFEQKILPTLNKFWRPKNLKKRQLY